MLTDVFLCVTVLAYFYFIINIDAKIDKCVDFTWLSKCRLSKEPVSFCSKIRHYVYVKSCATVNYT